MTDAGDAEGSLYRRSRSSAPSATTTMTASNTIARTVRIAAAIGTRTTMSCETAASHEILTGKLHTHAAQPGVERERRNSCDEHNPPRDRACEDEDPLDRRHDEREPQSLPP